MTPPAAATARTAPGHTRPAVRQRPRPRAVPAPAPRGRRVSGPARPRSAAPRRAALVDGGTLLDRLIHGRVWIAFVAVALVGLVFLQVSLLKLNSGIGRAVQTAATLERQNASLRAEVSRLDSGERIQVVADRLGLVMPAAGDRRYLRAGGGGYAAQAARGLTAPAPVVQQPLEPDPTTQPGPVGADPQVAGTVAPAVAQPPAQATGAPAPVTPTATPAQTQAAPQAAQTDPGAAPPGTTAGAVSAPATTAPAPG